MAKINLLPWRAERRRVREREFYMMLGAAAVAAVIVFGIWWYWMGLRIENQEDRNVYLRNEIKQLDTQLAEIKELDKTKSKLLARKQIIEQLQASRSQMVHLFDELVRTIPDSVRLSSLRQGGDTLTLQGVAQSNASVATYMRNLDNSKWLTHSDLIKTEVKGSDKRNRYEFGVRVRLRQHGRGCPGVGRAAAGGGVSATAPRLRRRRTASPVRRSRPRPPTAASGPARRAAPPR